VALGLTPERTLLNDINPHLINFYRWLQRGLVIDIPLRNDAQTYYAHREAFNQLLQEGRQDSKQVAELFYYLNRTGYNGLCRFNRSGLFNVPFGRYKTIGYTTDFTAYASVLAPWPFACQDFEALPTEPTDFIYADPPYDVEFRQYAKDGFDWPEQVRLAAYLARHPGPVVLSNQATGRIVELYRELGFEVRFLEAPRMMSCTGDRAPAREVLASRNLRCHDDPGTWK
jgi:DNA adenine methylase